MNRDDLLKLGRAIDEISLEADRLSRRLARLAERCGVKPPDAGGLSENDRQTLREALQHRLITTGSPNHQDELKDLWRRLSGS